MLTAVEFSQGLQETAWIMNSYEALEIWLKVSRKYIAIKIYED